MRRAPVYSWYQTNNVCRGSALGRFDGRAMARKVSAGWLGQVPFETISSFTWFLSSWSGPPRKPPVRGKDHNFQCFASTCQARRGPMRESSRTISDSKQTIATRDPRFDRANGLKFRGHGSIVAVTRSSRLPRRICCDSQECRLVRPRTQFDVGSLSKRGPSLPIHLGRISNGLRYSKNLSVSLAA